MLRNSGFSLVEILAAVAICGILAALAIPAISQLRESARLSAERANARQSTEFSASLLGMGTVSVIPESLGGTLATLRLFREGVIIPQGQFQGRVFRLPGLKDPELQRIARYLKISVNQGNLVLVYEPRGGQSPGEDGVAPSSLVPVSVSQSSAGMLAEAAAVQTGSPGELFSDYGWGLASTLSRLTAEQQLRVFGLSFGTGTGGSEEDPGETPDGGDNELADLYPVTPIPLPPPHPVPAPVDDDVGDDNNGDDDPPGGNPAPGSGGEEEVQGGDGGSQVSDHNNDDDQASPVDMPPADVENGGPDSLPPVIAGLPDDDEDDDDDEPG